MTHQEILDIVPVKSETHGTLDACLFREFTGEMFLFLEYYQPEREIFEILVYCLDEDFVMGGAADAGCLIRPGLDLNQKPYGCLEDIYVRQSFRRRGIAMYLIERLISYANRQGYLSLCGGMPR